MRELRELGGPATRDDASPGADATPAMQNRAVEGKGKK
jgi:hypothetical protein